MVLVQQSFKPDVQSVCKEDVTSAVLYQDFETLAVSSIAIVKFDRSFCVLC